MPVPVELDEIDTAIKAFTQRLTTLKTAAKDLIVARNKLTVELQDEEEAYGQKREHLAEVLSTNLVDMWAYAHAREEMETSMDRLVVGRNMVLDYETKLKAVHDEIPAVEELLQQARAERAEWGEVIPFSAGRRR